MEYVSDTSLSDQERKLRTQDTLQEEDFSTLIISSAIDGICAYDREIKMTLWNEAMERITGLKKSDVLGQPIFERFPFLVRFNLQNAVRGPLSGKSIDLPEIPFDIPETGRKGFLRCQASPLYDEEGRIVGGLAFTHEITDHKQALDEIEVRKRAETRLKFLSESGLLLSGTLDYAEVLKRIIDLSTRQFGAWCKLRLLEEDGTLNTFEGHQDPALAELFSNIETKYPPPADLKSGPHWVLKNGGHQFQPKMTEEMKRAYTTDPEHLRHLAPMMSYICVPLQTHGQILGTFSLVGTERTYTEHDLSLAYDLARWIALALENARLYGRAQRAQKNS